MNEVQEKIARARKELDGESPLEVLRWVEQHIDRPVFASSLGQEDQVLLHLIATNRLDIPVVTLDTGRLFPETYDLIAENETRYGVRIQVLFPDAREVEEMVSEEGINLFYKGVEQRKRCCRIRKTHPLQRVLSRSCGWICGLRREQSDARSAVQVIELDEANGIPKINPLHDWSLEQVVRYLKENEIPYNPLHDQGFTSIGCACCTRAVEPGADPRSGRWWWESSGKKECGLHWVDGVPVRNKGNGETR